MLVTSAPTRCELEVYFFASLVPRPNYPQLRMDYITATPLEARASVPPTLSSGSESPVGSLSAAMKSAHSEEYLPATRSDSRECDEFSPSPGPPPLDARHGMGPGPGMDPGYDGMRPGPGGMGPGPGGMGPLGPYWHSFNYGPPRPGPNMGPMAPPMGPYQSGPPPPHMTENRYDSVPILQKDKFPYMPQEPSNSAQVKQEFNDDSNQHMYGTYQCGNHGSSLTYTEHGDGTLPICKHKMYILYIYRVSDTRGVETTFARMDLLNSLVSISWSTSQKAAPSTPQVYVGEASPGGRAVCCLVVAVIKRITAIGRLISARWLDTNL
ncbi:hypothetical protein EMCRGX_G031877 [Ephydatia muelleri]